ncbi:OSM3-like kinesin [Perkinsela sp. CCAP 1560/4]|nr:OSM3-like kinesin [Perkinsela sp. CCAP 1560/4]|eukprot:KNH09605.1 OSM3-like kinesin [Perkinsela sp. CCAP 1560/4]
MSRVTESHAATRSASGRKSPLTKRNSVEPIDDLNESVGKLTLSPGNAKSHKAKSSENIKVALRVRSFLPRERRDGHESCIRMKDHTCELSLDKKVKYPFTFDYCFWSNDVSDEEMPYSTQADVFSKLGPPIIEHILSGMNASIIAYGQTGSGKTYSLYGPPNPTDETFGLVPRICDGLFSRLSTESQHFKATVSIVEIYMERTFDLLKQRKELQIRGDLRNGFQVLNASRIEVSSYQSILPLLRDADLQKTYSSTALNERSSRAHTLFELDVRTFGPKGTRISKLMLVDLAGSERVKASGAEGKIFDQACNINLSLMNLGRCIEGVMSNSNAHTHLVEFRHSALTKLLKESLGGNAKTMILATVSPAVTEANNTLHALRFADRAKKIRTHAVINEYSQERQRLESDEITKTFEAKMEGLKTEYELEKKQQTLLGRQIELEQQISLLEEERLALSRQREDCLQLSLKEREHLAQREREISSAAAKIQAELITMHTRRTELEAKMDEITCQNNQFLVEKRIADKEILSLHEEISEIQTSYRQQVNDKERLKVAYDELEERSNIGDQFSNAILDTLPQQLKGHIHIANLAFKVELLGERRLHQSEATELKQRIAQADKECKSLQRRYDDASRASEKNVSRLEEELHTAKSGLENLQEEITMVKNTYSSQVEELTLEIDGLRAHHTTMKEELIDSYSRTQLAQVLKEELMDRQNISLDEQGMFFLLQTQAERLLELLRQEEMDRAKLVIDEYTSHQDIREEYFLEQKKIFYRKALSLTKCIRADRF